MKPELLLSNQRRGVRVDLRLLKQILLHVLHERLDRRDYELGFCFVGIARMTELNESFLRHAGSTDIITFNYNDPERPDRLAGDITICLDEVRIQARRFRVPWTTELVRCCIHGILHLVGYDDLTPAKRRVMKRMENRLLRQAAGRFELAKTAGRA